MDQYRNLEQHALNDFKARAEKYLRHAHPDAPFLASQGAVLLFIEEAANKAREYNIVREVDIVRFIDVLVAVGTDFELNHRYAWIADYLREPVRAEFRIDCACERLRFGNGPIS